MIDRDSRDCLAFALRQLAAGLITNDEFESRVFALPQSTTGDAAIGELTEFGMLHYGDLSTYRLRGRNALTPESRRAVARAVLFLKSDQEYIHGTCLENQIYGPRGSSLGMLGWLALPLIAGAATYALLNTFTLGFVSITTLMFLTFLFVQAIRDALHRYRWRWHSPALEGTFWPLETASASEEQFRFWPFESEATFKRAITRPPFLCG